MVSISERFKRTYDPITKSYEASKRANTGGGLGIGYSIQSIEDQM